MQTTLSCTALSALGLFPLLFFFLLPPPLPPLLCTSPESLFHLPRNFLLCGMKVEHRALLGVRAAAGCASPACIQTPQPSPVAPNSLPLSTHAHACTQQCTHLQNHTAILGSKPDIFFFNLFFFPKISLKHTGFSKTVPVFKPQSDLEEGKKHPTSACKNVKLKSVPDSAVILRHYYTTRWPSLC